MIGVWQTGGIRVGRIGGVAVEIHLTFGLVLAWAAWQGWLSYGNLPGLGYGLLAISLLFASVLLHELGHAWAARHYGLSVRRVTLLPVGGLAQLATSPSHPWQELVIALAGPLINLALAVGLGGLAILIQPAIWQNWLDSLLFRAPPSLPGILWFLMWSNAILFFFNMLPAFPMDGGRVIRAALAVLTSYEAATRIAAWAGRGMALLLAVLGGFGWLSGRAVSAPLLLVMAPVVYWGAWQEEACVRRRRALVQLEVGAICQRPRAVAAPWDPITRSMAAQLLEKDTVLPVLVEGRIVGLMTYQDIQSADRSALPPTVGHTMRTQFPVVQPGDTLWVALQEITASQLPAVPVVEGGLFRGMVTLERIKQAARRRPR